MMKKRLLTMALMVMALVCVMTIGASAAESVDKSSVVSTQTTSFFSTYYNKYQEKTFDWGEVNNSIAYVDLGTASDFGATGSSLTIGDTTFTSSEAYYCSIGNSSYLPLYVWKVESNNLYVALPYLVTLAETDGTLVVGDQTVTVYTTDVAPLSIASVTMAGSTTGSVASVSYDSETNTISYESNYGGNSYKLALKDNSDSTLTSSQNIFRITSDNSVGATKTESDGTYQKYPYYNSEKLFTEDSTTTETNYLYVEGVGSVSYDIEFTYNAAPAVVETSGEKTGYGTFDAALSAATNTGGTIYLNDSVEVTTLTVPANVTLNIAEDVTLTIAEGVTPTSTNTVTNNGIIINNGEIANGGTLTTNGIIANYGSIANSGSLTTNGVLANYGSITGVTKGAITTVSAGTELWALNAAKSYSTPVDTSDKIVIITSAEELALFANGNL